MQEPKKLNATQLQELKDVTKDILKYRRRSQLFTIQFSQLHLVRELIPSGVCIEIENKKWLYLKSKKKK